MKKFEIARYNDRSYEAVQPWDQWDAYANCWTCRHCGAAAGYQIHNPNCPADSTAGSRSFSPRHLAYVEADFASWQRGGSCRTAVCLCGWRGGQRATLELAVDDALLHEHSGMHIVRRRGIEAAENSQRWAIERLTADDRRLTADP